MNDFSRRGLLKATATAGMARSFSRALRPQKPGRERDDQRRRKRTRRPAKLTGRVVRQRPRYPDARLGWDELFVRYPLVIVFAQETQDVVNALTWARQNDVALRVRSGRHSLEGWSNVDNGIVIDVSELKSVRIDSASRIATVGAGLTQLEAVTTLAKKDLAVTTGTEGTVGLSGATLGGGFGFLTRYLGMACDSLMAAEIVVASGARRAKVIKADLKITRTCSGRSAGRETATSGSSPPSPIRRLRSGASPICRRRGRASRTCIGSSTHSSARHRSPTTASEPRSRSTENQILLSRSSRTARRREVKELLAPILSVGKPDVTVQVGNWGDVYAGFQIPTADEPANWKFFSQFAIEPFPKRAISLVASFMQTPPRMTATTSPRPSAGRSRGAPPRRHGVPAPPRAFLFRARRRAGGLVDNQTAASRSPRRPRPGSPSSARRCGPT